MSSYNRVAATLGAALLAGAAGFSVLSAQTADNGDRRRAIGDWLVEDVADEDGRTVRISHEVGDVRISYDFWLPAEANRLVHGATIQHFNCGHGGGEVAPPDSEITAAAARAQIVADFDRCEVGPAERATLLAGFDQAYAAAGEWLSDERANAVAGHLVTQSIENDSGAYIAENMSQDDDAGLLSVGNNAMDVNMMTEPDMSMNDDGADVSVNGMDDSGPY